MFERQVELEQRQGIRGPFTRFFSPLSSVEEARLASRAAAMAAFCGAAGWVLVSFFIGAPVLILAVLCAVPAIVLYFRASRAAANTLKLIGIVVLLSGATSLATQTILPWPPLLLGGITFLSGWRAGQAIAVIRPNYLEAYHARQAQPDDDSSQSESGNGV